MSVKTRRVGGASVFLAAAAFASIAAGVLVGACALPGYSLGDAGSSGAGTTTSSGGGATATGSGGAGGRDTGTGGMTGAGGGGGTLCLTPKDCGAPPGPCKGFECKAGECIPILINGEYPGGADPVNPNGDCNKATCVDGALKYVADPNDLPIDDNKCTDDLCFAGFVIEHAPVAGTCTLDPTQSAEPGVCNSFGKCVECFPGGGACPGGCEQDQCIGNTCTDSQKSGTETGIDCGGPCPPCAVGGGCANGFDCESGVCKGGICGAAGCADGVRNGSEGDVDCGAACQKPCHVGQSCAVHEDCKSLYCKKGTCQFTCGSGAKEGAETDVDCGGPICPPCVP